MIDVLNYSGNLTISKCWCGLRHAIPSELAEAQSKNGSVVAFCPMGHEYVQRVGETPDQKRARQAEAALASERARHDQTRAALKSAADERNAERAAKARIKNRIKNGVCPCCNRSFSNLHRHMTNQHPDFAPDKKKPNTPARDGGG